VAAVSSEGRLLVFPAAELPELPRGKGNKIFGISTRKFKAGEEKLVAVAVLEPGESLLLSSNQRTMTLKPGDLAGYAGARSQRGGLLPRGWRKVDRLAVVPSA
jgi:topoisomerase-4 subunit A